MAIYYCPQCNKKYFVDNLDAVEETIQCSMCGCSINFKKLDEEYSERRKHIIFEETEPIESIPVDTNAAEDISPIGTDIINRLLTIQKMQLDELRSIKNMLKFFTILTIISLVISFLSATVLFN